MKPIDIRIKDFQSIEDLNLEISGFTCVTGPTNIGKSAIIRAISSAILNKSVVGSVRKGKKFCTVEVDGLKWEKGERVGRYWVPGERDENGNPKPRDGIGQGQTEVTEIMGFRSVKVGDKYINPWLATQFDPIFLMQDSGPAVTDFISDITHLKVLQDAIVVLVENRGRILSSVKDKEEELVEVTAREAALGGLDNLLRAEKDLVQQTESLAEYGRAIARLRHFISTIESENAVMASLAPAKEVRVPKAPADPGASLLPLAKLWAGIEEAAMRVSPIRGAMKVVVPDVPDPAELESIRRTSRFLSIPSLSASVAALEGAKKTKVPEAPKSELESLSRVAALLLELEAIRSLISRLSAEMPVVPDFPAPRFSNSNGISWAAGAMVRLEKEASSIVAMGEQLRKVEADISSTEEELSKIPTCPTCPAGTRSGPPTRVITWKDRSQPAMRRPVRGHSVMLDRFMLSARRPGGRVLFALQMVCLTCRTIWFEDMSTATRDRVVHGPNRRRAVSDVVTAAVSKTPTCEDAYRATVARDVMES